MKLYQITLLAAGITASAPNLKTVYFNCVGLRDEVRYAHPKDCTKFFKCSNGVADVYECPQAFANDPASKLEFNNDLRVCDWPANFTCDGEAAWESCGGGRVDGTAKYPGYDTSQYFTCSGGTSNGLTSCTGSNKFDAFRRECVANNDPDLVTWETLADDGKNVNTFDASYANKNGENVTFEGSSTYKKFYALKEDELEALDGNTPAQTPVEPPVTPEYIFNASKSITTNQSISIDKKSVNSLVDQFDNNVAIITLGDDGELSTTENTVINLRYPYTPMVISTYHEVGVTYVDQMDPSMDQDDWNDFWANDSCGFIADNRDVEEGEAPEYYKWCEGAGGSSSIAIPGAVDLYYEITFKPIEKQVCLKANDVDIGCQNVTKTAKYFYVKNGMIANAIEITS